MSSPQVIENGYVGELRAPALSPLAQTPGAVFKSGVQPRSFPQTPAPGSERSPDRLHPLTPDADIQAQPEIEKLLMAEIPLSRWGQPDQIAGFELYLASDVTAYFIDGGNQAALELALIFTAGDLRTGRP